MDMGRLVRLMTEEVYPVRTRTENGGHMTRKRTESGREPVRSERGLTLGINGGA
jgi:hypothetical protein